MGREVRMVPANWEHPKNQKGRYIPLFEGSNLSSEIAEYKEHKTQWLKGYVWSWEQDKYITFAENNAETGLQWGIDMDNDLGPEPNPAWHMPEWIDEEKTHFQMYENTSEGTPISPPMPDIESLARWLTDNNASAFGERTATYEQWLATCKSGWAMSGMVIGGQVMSGVEFNAITEKQIKK